MPHCEECWTEFVDGIAQCSDCGGPLRDGPLPEASAVAEDEVAGAAAGVDARTIDTLVGELPGEDAEYLAEALKLEGIHSRLVCGGLSRLRGPGQQATGPLALNLPVQVFVAGVEVERAQEILESIGHEDLVGDAWAEGLADHPAEDDAEERGQTGAESIGPPLEMRAEGTSSRVVLVLLLAAAVGLLFLFSR